MSWDWIAADWPAPPNVRAFSTTREGGNSKGPWGGFNLASRCGDDVQNVRQNRQLLDTALPSPANWLHQVHGVVVKQYCGKTGVEMEADAMVSFEVDQVCAILTADCLPVFFCDGAGSRVGVAHAGWRGLAAGVLQSTIAALNVRPNDVMAWLGPAIGPSVYEVGPEVAAAFPDEFPLGFTVHGDRFLMDIYQLARLKLQALGLRVIHGGDYCTYKEPDRFFSFRRDGVTGRMANLIWLTD
jgi:YfiH family protein